MCMHFFDYLVDDGIIIMYVFMSAKTILFYFHLALVVGSVVLSNNTYMCCAEYCNKHL